MFGLIKKYWGRRKYSSKQPTGPNWPTSWWQTDRHLQDPQEFGPVFACIQIIAQEIAKLPIHHYRRNADGSKTILPNTAATRVLRKPNGYQTRSDFFMYLLQNLLYEGNGYALAERNERGEINRLYPLNSRNTWPHVDPISKEVIYRVGDNSQELLKVENISEAVPMRNMLHIRVYTPRNAIIGETPITAAAASASLGLSIENNGAAFFNNQSRPSGVLRVPGKLGKEARDRLRESWKENHSKGNQGQIGILSDGAEWQQITMSAQDADLVNTHRMTIEDVARVFRVPIFMLGDLSKATLNNVESLTRLFYSGALSFYLEHIEAALDALFTLPPDQFIQFDFEANLRTNFKEHIEGLAAGTTGGIFKIDEARARLSLPNVEGGDNVFIQQQLQTVADRAENQPLDAGTDTGGESAPMDDDTQRVISGAIQKAVEHELYH